MSDQLTTVEPVPLAIQRPPSTAELLRAVVQNAITPESVQALEALCKLQNQQEEKEQAREFARAFAALQADMPAIATTKPVQNRDGTTRYKFAPYEEIMDKAKPILARHGFSVAFDTEWQDNGRLKVTCTLSHSAGHSKSNSFAARVGGGPPGANEAQADRAVTTYAKRGALCDALNIVIDHDSDARAEGSDEVITTAEAHDLARRVLATNSDDAAFLEFCGVDSFDKIPRSKLERAQRALAKKEREMGGKTPKPTDPDQW